MNDIIIQFDADPNLGRVVQSKALKCEIGDVAQLLKIKPDIDPKVFIKYLLSFCNSKTGYLIGFSFTSAIEGMKYPNFCVMYIPRIKGALSRQTNRGKSRWEFWQVKSRNDYNVLSIFDLKNIYNFDAEKFFASDYCIQSIEKFKRYVGQHLTNTIKPFAQSIVNNHDKLYAIQLINAMNDSLIDIESQTLEYRGEDHSGGARDKVTYGQHRWYNNR